jgi:membrane glycosyltransferase
MTALFAVLFAWISVGFWSSLTGFLLLIIKKDRFKITRGLPSAGTEIKLPTDFVTAILFPVYNEDPFKVSAGVKTLRKVLEDAGTSSHFDIYLLSDSTNPDTWVLEEEAYHQLLRDFQAMEEKEGDGEAGEAGEDEDGFLKDGAGNTSNLEGKAKGGGLYYRHRQSNLKRKSGNIADFCRRYGKDYRYMIVFDADSLMSADALGRLVAAMEQRPDVGIIQTAPKAIFSKTPLSMVQEFANHLYGGVFAAGLHFWQLGDAQFWGHNAIIRTEPFMEYCQLSRLKGRSAMSGDILSHDFVESALMRRGGYGVWLAYDQDGSYEMTPPTLTDELARDRRWCQGNLQHIRLIFTRGFFPTHRALFLNGIMSYGSALLWFIFLLLSTMEAVMALISGPVYFPEGPSLFTDWPKYFPAWALALLSSTALLLFFPKILSVIYVTIRLKCNGFGGMLPLLVSVAFEIIISTLLAPVRMLFHTHFVFMTLIGVKVGWNPQNRGSESGLSWGSALKVYWIPTILGIFWGLTMFVLSRGFFYWLSPVAVGLAISVPLAVYTSRERLGAALSRLGIFLTPPETMPSKEIKLLREAFDTPPPPELLPIPQEAGFNRAVVLPKTLSIHLAVSGHHRKSFPSKQERLDAAITKALERGPEALTRLEKKLLLNDREALIRLHKEVWKLDDEKARAWGIIY